LLGRQPFTHVRLQEWLNKGGIRSASAARPQRKQNTIKYIKIFSYEYIVILSKQNLEFLFPIFIFLFKYLTDKFQDKKGIKNFEKFTVNKKIFKV